MLHTYIIHTHTNTYIHSHFSTQNSRTNFIAVFCTIDNIHNIHTHTSTYIHTHSPTQNSRTNFIAACGTIDLSHYPWQTRARTQMDHSFSLQQCPLRGWITSILCLDAWSKGWTLCRYALAVVVQLCVRDFVHDVCLYVR